MSLTSSMKMSAAALLILATSTTALAQPRLHNLDIQVVLAKNGDASITETRMMTIDDTGTECFIGLGDMSPSTVIDLTVSDESGRQYQNIGKWMVDRSRAEKAGRCGIVEKGDGDYELCWGIGDSGERTFVTKYTITGLVRAYPDADAFRHVFLDEDVSPKPEHAKVTIVGADTTLVFTPDTCGIWGFRFIGDLGFENGTMVAETTEPMNSEAALYIMAKFPKGMLEPSIQITDDTFEHKKDLAFEGSDYVEAVIAKSSERSNGHLKALGIIGGCIAGLFGLIVFIFMGIPRYKRRKHEKWVQSIDYFRSIPLNGNLQQANDMLNAFNFGRAEDYKRLLSATVLQLINEGAFAVQHVQTEKGEMEKRFVVHKDLSEEKDLSPLAFKMHKIFLNAAGENLVLDPKELETFMENQDNWKTMRGFMELLYTKRSSGYYKNHEDEMREVYGFKRFLEDFTLMNERHLTETRLWRDYMVWATLYGNAEQVMKDMKAINPEFFKMDQIASQLTDSIVLPAVYASIFKGTEHALGIMEENRLNALSSSSRRSSSSSRSSGRGGHSSWRGGGGGFSGRGGGGGIR